MRRTSLSKNGKDKIQLRPNRQPGEQNKAKPENDVICVVGIGAGNIQNSKALSVFEDRKTRLTN